MLSRHIHRACATPHTAMCSKGAPRRPAMRAAPALTNRPHSRFVRSGLSSHSGPARACVRLRPSPRPVTCLVAFRPPGEDSPQRAPQVAHGVRGPHDPHSRAHSRGTRARCSSHGAHSCAPRASPARVPSLSKDYPHLEVRLLSLPRLRHQVPHPRLGGHSAVPRQPAPLCRRLVTGPTIRRA